jgi:flavodoxin I
LWRRSGCCISSCYDFVDSLGVEDGQFMGLALDDDHQKKLTNPRIARWVRQLIGEFGIG